jgi:two-component system, NtrC family, sensor kinase
MAGPILTTSDVPLLCGHLRSRPDRVVWPRGTHMAKTTRKAGERATATGRGGLRARKSGVAKTHNAKLRKLKQAKPGSRKRRPSQPSETASLKRQLKAVRMQQQASAEILSTVANASGDVARPLQQIAETTARLFGAPSVSIQLAEGGEFTREYRVGAIAQRIGSAYPRSNIRVGGRNLPGTVVFENRQIHIPDLDHLDPSMSDFPGLPHARAGGARTVCGTPLRLENKAIGVLIVFRDRLLPFTDDELTLQQSFADQAVIAIENARLFNETKETLERQTATSEILRVISQSPTDVQPVFDAIVQTAVRLIRCDIAFVLRCDGATFSPAAAAGPDGPLPDLGPSHLPIDPDANFPSRAIVGKKNVHLPDWSLIDLPEHERQMQALIGVNSALFLPLLREAECIGVLALAGKQANIFGESEIALAESFRDQALIAIENVRLFKDVQAKTADLQESLQQQTATADVLKVISRSAFDLQAVLDTLTSSAVELSGATNGVIALREGDAYRYRAFSASMTPDFARYLAEHPPIPGPSSGAGRAILSGRIEMIQDVLEDPSYTLPMPSLNQTRSILAVPLLRDDRIEGAFVVTGAEPGPFPQRQIDLIQTFADQAAIAIKNTRLFEEVEARTKELAASLDDLRTAQDRLIQTEKLASLGQLTAGIAHEIKNPLNFVNNFSALSAELTDELNDALRPVALEDRVRKEIDELTGLLKDNLEKVVQHGKRADSIVKNMLLHSREGSGDCRAVEINVIIDESLNLAYHGARAENPDFNITLQRDLDPVAGMADVYPQEITRVLLNLISNGFYAATRRAAENADGFAPTLRAATKNLGDKIEIRIRDNGIGIAPEVKEKIFNPFFTTKPAGEGTGLGLSMSHDIVVKQHGGTIDVDTEPGVFTEFIVTLPRSIIPRRTTGGKN